TDKRSNSPEGRQSLTGFELASRLSYFLWRSMPDDELLLVAGEQKLHDDAVLSQQVARMFADPQSHALVENFVGQWLNLRRLTSGDVSPDPGTCPEVGTQLLPDMRREAELFIASIFNEDRPLTELLTAKHTFVNKRLARLYGIENVKWPDEKKEDEF